MYSEANLKGTKETPMVFGVRGRLIMLLVASEVLETVICVILMVAFFFNKKIALGFLVLAFWLIGFFFIFIFFRWISTVKDFKKIKKRPDIITNKNLIDYL
ncbi:MULTISPECIES: hypothetical protein [unclassified Chryseobacterium]|uniref:hypothetical protein n=1 Tax=unclassified Chryseobacterium TaxID=2593645 RepID=UPI0028531E29|nr:hypothetical protein [Chryseobacterium sp. CFS7]MDR4895103.1 hypothetical protein [Chryseobacterium sp. CFS7]